jgi:DNA modification methylase
MNKYPKIPISALIPDPENTRKDLQPTDPEYVRIKNSIGTFGFLDPIIFNTRTKDLIGGHQRLKILKADGVTELYTVSIGAYSWAFPEADLQELSETEERAAKIGLNKATGDWDYGSLVASLNKLKADDFDIDLTGFGDKDLVQFMADVNKKKTIPEDDYIPPKKIKTTIHEGDIIRLGRHLLMCGDATREESHKALLGNITPDLVLTDPPYGISAVRKRVADEEETVGGGGPLKFGSPGGSRKGTIIRAHLYPVIEGDDNTDTAKKVYLLIKSLNCIIFGGQFFTDFLPPTRCWIVWDKQVSGDFADFEMAWTSFNKPAHLYHWLWSGVSRKGDRKSELVSRIHPTQKPVGLFAEILKDYSKEGATILDPFLGSGITIIACEQSNRTCLGMEISPEYCEIICDRWETFTGLKRQLEKKSKGRR